MRTRRVVELSGRGAPSITEFGDVALVDAVARDLKPVAALAQHPTDQITFMNLTCDPWKYSLSDLGLFNLETRQKMPVVF